MQSGVQTHDLVLQRRLTVLGEYTRGHGNIQTNKKNARTLYGICTLRAVCDIPPLAVRTAPSSKTSPISHIYYVYIYRVDSFQLRVLAAALVSRWQESGEDLKNNLILARSLRRRIRRRRRHATPRML